MARGRKKLANAGDASRLVDAFASDTKIPIPESITSVNTPEKEQMWQDLTDCRPAAQWLKHDLHVLAEIIEMQNAMAHQWQRVMDDGLTDLSPKGVTVVSGKLTAYLQLGARRDSLLRLLKISATSDHGSKAQTNRRGALQKQDALRTMQRTKDTLLA
jgi:hypothetical protein